MKLQVTQALHSDHVATLGLIERFETALRRRPDAAAVSALLRDLRGLLAAEIASHFRFEEEQLFTRLADSGEADIAAFLAEEHQSIRDIAAVLDALADTALRDGLDDAGWKELSRAGLAFAEAEISHIQKEEMALLPMLEMLLDPGHDARLMAEFASLR